MTENINKYSNGKIYKIISYSHPDVVYYGSTVNALNKRMSQHRASTNKTASKQIINFGDAVILLVENFSCKNKEELNRKEGEYILNNDCINKQIAGRTLKEYSHKYYIEHKEQIQKNRDLPENKIIAKEYNQKYRTDNKEEINNQRKIYRDKEENKIAKKEYYELNKEKQVARQSEKYDCICGKSVTIGKKSRHNKSQHHIKHLEI